MLFGKVIKISLFYGFKGKYDLVISNIQYVDDTLILTEKIIENLWIIKSLLWGFEIASELRVNFAKSSVTKVNVDSKILRAFDRC